LKRIVFVCSGNTCRSPLAEGIAKKILLEANPQQFDISSAGSSALDGLPASSQSVDVARDHSIDLTAHQARLLSKTLVAQADLIVAMSESHRETVGVIEPQALAHTFLLTDFCDEVDGDIPDPIGMGQEVYGHTYEMIEKCIQEMKSKLNAFDKWKE